MTATNQNIESDPDQGRGNRIDAGGGRECATNAKSVQVSMDHFARAVARLQKLDSNLMGDNQTSIVSRTTWKATSVAYGPPVTWQMAAYRAAKSAGVASRQVPKGSSAGRSVSVAIVSPIMTEKRRRSLRH